MSETDNQRSRVLELMKDGKYRTLFEIENQLRQRGYCYLTTSISARLREIRALGFEIEKYSEGKTWWYRVIVPVPASL